MIEALIANRLMSPTPLVHVEDWAREWAVEEIFDLDAASLNDDRIGRALDALAPASDGIVGSIGMTAIAAFGLDVARLHWDMTSISLFGDYAEPLPGFVAPRYGHPKDRRPDLKQVQTGLAVTGDGGIPVFHRAYHGGAGEVAQVVPGMEALVAIAAERRFLLVGDTKLVSYSNLAAMIDAGVSFIAPASKSHVSAEVLAACDHAATVPVDYVATRDHDRSADKRDPTVTNADGPQRTNLFGQKNKGSYRLESIPVKVPRSSEPTEATTARHDHSPRDVHRRWRGGWRPAGALSRSAPPARRRPLRATDAAEPIAVSVMNPQTALASGYGESAVDAGEAGRVPAEVLGVVTLPAAPEPWGWWPYQS